METAIFAGGCFWCLEEPFCSLIGVVSVIPGYVECPEPNPSYKQICTGKYGREAVRITYDPTIVSYEELLSLFWRNIDPTDEGGQFADRGEQYKTAIYCVNSAQYETAVNSKSELESSSKFNRPIRTEVKEATEFYPAELSHQQYFRKNPQHYQQYKKGSGRQDFITRNWK
ncbi:hypothetical protein RCL1_004349 [Eukaryota sp. TZLM3-RCL]